MGWKTVTCELQYMEFEMRQSWGLFGICWRAYTKTHWRVSNEVLTWFYGDGEACGDRVDFTDRLRLLLVSGRLLPKVTCLRLFGHLSLTILNLWQRRCFIDIPETLRELKRHRVQRGRDLHFVSIIVVGILSRLHSPFSLRFANLESSLEPCNFW